MTLNGQVDPPWTSHVVPAASAVADPGASKKQFIRDLYTVLARRYDRINRLISLGQDRRWRGFFAVYFHRMMPALTRALNRSAGRAYTYLAGSVVELPPSDRIAQTFRKAGFSSVRIRRLWGGVATVFDISGADAASPD